MEKVRMGLIGCGGNMGGHIGRLMKMQDVEVVALADPSEASFARLFERVPQAEAVAEVCRSQGDACQCGDGCDRDFYAAYLAF